VGAPVFAVEPVFPELLAVVGQQDDQRVLVPALRLQRVEQSPEVAVEVPYLGVVGREQLLEVRGVRDAGVAR